MLAWTEKQIRKSMGKNVDKFDVLKFTLNGYSQPDPINQDVATADFRVFVQTRDRCVDNRHLMVLSEKMKLTVNRRSLVVKDTMEIPG